MNEKEREREYMREMERNGFSHKIVGSTFRSLWCFLFELCEPEQAANSKK